MLPVCSRTSRPRAGRRPPPRREGCGAGFGVGRRHLRTTSARWHPSGLPSLQQAESVNQQLTVNVRERAERLRRALHDGFASDMRVRRRAREQSTASS